MNFPFSHFKKSSQETQKKPRMGFGREHMVVAGVFGMIFLLAFFLVWGGFLFYMTVFIKDVPVPSSSFVKPSFSSEKIDETIKLLDARDEKLNQILTGTDIPAATTSPENKTTPPAGIEPASTP